MFRLNNYKPPYSFKGSFKIRKNKDFNYFNSISTINETLTLETLTTNIYQDGLYYLTQNLTNNINNITSNPNTFTNIINDFKNKFPETYENVENYLTNVNKKQNDTIEEFNYTPPPDIQIDPEEAAKEALKIELNLCQSDPYEPKTIPNNYLEITKSILNAVSAYSKRTSSRNIDIKFRGGSYDLNLLRIENLKILEEFYKILYICCDDLGYINLEEANIENIFLEIGKIIIKNNSFNFNEIRNYNNIPELNFSFEVYNLDILKAVALGIAKQIEDNKKNKIKNLTPEEKDLLTNNGELNIEEVVKGEFLLKEYKYFLLHNEKNYLLNEIIISVEDDFGNVKTVVHSSFIIDKTEDLIVEPIHYTDKTIKYTLKFVPLIRFLLDKPIYLAPFYNDPDENTASIEITNDVPTIPTLPNQANNRSLSGTVVTWGIGGSNYFTNTVLERNPDTRRLPEFETQNLSPEIKGVSSKKTVKSGYFKIPLNTLDTQFESEIDQNLETYFFQKEPFNITDTTTLSNELEKCKSITLGYFIFNNQITIVPSEERSNHSISTLIGDVIYENKLIKPYFQYYPLSFYKSVEELEEELEEENNTNKPFYFKFNNLKKTTVVENEKAIECPDYIKNINSLDLCFDLSGETKSKIITIYLGDKILEQIVETYGFVFNSLDIYDIDFGSSPFDKFEPKVTSKNVNASGFWKQISYEKDTYTYGLYDYLTKINKNGWRLARFDSGEEEISSYIRRQELYYKSGSDNSKLSEKEKAEYELLEWKLENFKFIQIPTEGYTNFHLHPIDGIFKDKDYIKEQYIIYTNEKTNKKYAIYNKSYTPSYFASSIKTFKSSFAKRDNKIITNSNPDSKPFVLDFYQKPYLLTGEEYIEEFNIQVEKNSSLYYYVTNLSGFPLYGSSNSFTPKYLQYNRKTYTQDDNFNNFNTEENTVYSEGIPPEHIHLKNQYTLQFYEDDKIKDLKEEEDKTITYYYDGKEIPEEKYFEKNKDYPVSVYPVKDKDLILPLLQNSLNEELNNSWETITFKTLYFPELKEGDILDLSTNKFSGKGIILSIKNYTTIDDIVTATEDDNKKKGKNYTYYPEFEAYFNEAPPPPASGKYENTNSLDYFKENQGAKIPRSLSKIQKKNNKFNNRFICISEITITNGIPTYLSLQKEDWTYKLTDEEDKDNVKEQMITIMASPIYLSGIGEYNNTVLKNRGSF